MAYEVYLRNILLPITPKSIKVTIPNNNSGIDLVNGEEYRVVKKGGLRDISFECLFPNFEYPFAQYVYSEFRPPEYFIGQLRDMKEKKEAFQFILNRKLPNGEYFWSDNIRVVLEDFNITESSDNGFDVLVDIKLKECITHITTIVDENGSSSTKRDDESSPKPKEDTSYSVKKGDSLWEIAKSHYGDGSKYTKILDANKSKIKNSNMIYPEQELVIPV